MRGKNAWIFRAVPSFCIFGAYSEVELERDYQTNEKKRAETLQHGETAQAGAASERFTVARISFLFVADKPDDAYRIMEDYFRKNGFYRSRQCFYSEEKISGEQCRAVIDGFFAENPRYYRYFIVSGEYGSQDIINELCSKKGMPDAFVREENTERE